MSSLLIWKQLAVTAITLTPQGCAARCDIGPRSNFKICRGGLRIIFPPRCTHSWPVTALSVAGLLLAHIPQIAKRARPCSESIRSRSPSSRRRSLRRIGKEATLVRLLPSYPYGLTGLISNVCCSVCGRVGMQSFNLWHSIILTVFLVLQAIPIAKILDRVGFSKWWTIAFLIPIVSLVTLWIFASARWPAIDRTA